MRKVNSVTTASSGSGGSATVTETNSGAIKTSVELLDNAVDGNYLNVNQNIAGTDVAAGAGAVSAQTQRMTLASDDPAVVAIKDEGTLATSSISLASGRYIPSSSGVQMARKRIGVQLTSADLSAQTTFTPEISLDGTSWDVAVENGEDLSHTVIVNVPFVRVYEVDKKVYFRLNMAGVTTGTITYKLLN